MPAPETRAAVTADGIDFVDEDNARRALLPLIEQVADAAGAHAHEHLDEVRTRNGEERYVRLPGDGPGQQGLAGAGRSYQQHAFRNPPAQLLKLLRLAGELDNLLEFFFRLIHPGNIFEGDLLLLGREQPGAALAEAERLVAAGLHLTHHEDPERDQQNEWRGVDEQRDPVVGLRFFDVDIDFLLLQQLY